MSQADLKAWYVSLHPTYLALSQVVASTIEKLLRQERIDFLAVTSRAKSVESLLEKCLRKHYDNPQVQITDLAGIRVVTYVDRDVARIQACVSKAFTVDTSDSADRSDVLGVDRFGYRSVHLICHVGELRAQLPEFSPYKGVRFEIQIRTALQHAWAEIEHDRSYKFAGRLPSHLKRRFYLVAGLLELADREFDSLTSEIAAYADEVTNKTRVGELRIEVNSTSLQKYLAQKVGDLKIRGTQMPIPEDLVEELQRFGVSNLEQLDALMTDDLFIALKRHSVENTYVGLLRDAMMYADIERYFSDAFKASWSGWDSDSITLFSEKYGKKLVHGLMNQYEIDLEPDDA